MSKIIKLHIFIDLYYKLFNPFTAPLSRIGAKLETVLVNRVGQL